VEARRGGAEQDQAAAARPPLCRPLRLAGDKRHSYPRVRAWLRRHGVKAVIPRRKRQRPSDGPGRLDREAYRRRSAVERRVGWLKGCRAVGTRFDKPSVN
jgi:hypothetical protein